MWGLICKDFYVYRKTFFLSLCVMIGLSIPYFVPLPLMDFTEEQQTLLKMVFIVFALFIFLCIGDAQTSLFTRDEQKAWMYFAICSPEGIRGQVLSKYYESTLLSLFGSLWCLFLFTIQGALSKTELPINILILLFYLQFFFRAMEFPFYIRFGSKYGNYYKLGIITIFVMIFAIYQLYGDRNHMITFEAVLNFLQTLDAEALTDFTLTLYGVFPWISLLAFYGSYRLSLWLCQKGVDSFE